VAVHDLRRVVVIVDNTRIPGGNDGDFFVLDELPTYTSASAASGRSQLDRSQQRDRTGSFSVGEYSEAARVLGAKRRLQIQRETAGAYEGLTFSFSDPQSGTTVAGVLVLSTDPAIERSATQTMTRWPFILREPVVDYGAAIPVGGGVLA